MLYTIIWFSKYHVIQKLGQGSSGTVFLAWHEGLHTYRAIKQIARRQEGSRWQNEINILKILKHPNIPIIYDMEEDDDYIYIIEEYIEGQSLRAYRYGQSGIEEQRLLDFLIQLCEVLDFLHSLHPPVLYLDLKPDNILITLENQLKLVDFGTARLLAKTNHPEKSYGTKGYAAPEQYGTCREDKRSDIYGIGGIIFFLAAGTAYAGEQQELRNLERTSFYSREFVQILTKCLEHRPSKRYASVSALKRAALQLSQKKNVFCKTPPHIITVSGMIPRIGTTHISLMMTAYLNQAGIPALYIEQNEARVVEQIKQGVDYRYLQKIPMARGEPRLLVQRSPQYKVFVCDRGVLGGQETGFANGSSNFLVLGSKPWEWKLPDNRMQATYLFNYTKQEDFVYLKQKMSFANCVRVPYVCDCFLAQKQPEAATFLQEILKDVLQKKKVHVFCRRQRAEKSRS